MTVNTHHTKLKGDIAVAAVILDLTKKGYIISEPMSENAPYDLICDTGNKLLRIQVKYRQDGKIPYRTSWADKNGSHTKDIDTSKIDYFALVNEDYSLICYPLAIMAGMSIRFKHPSKDSKFYSKYHYYEDYLTFKEELAPMHQLFSTNITSELIDKITKEKLITCINNCVSNQEVYNTLNISRKIYYNLLDKFEIEPIETYKDFSHVTKEMLETAIKNSKNNTQAYKSLNITIKAYKRLLKEFNLDAITKEITNKELKVTQVTKKIEWPSVEEMSVLVFEKPTQHLAKELGVSDVAIGKFCKKHNIAKPPRGYWAKQDALTNSKITE